MAVVTSINIEGDSLPAISTQTRMKETPARGPERHYEGVGGTQRDPCSIKKGNTYRIPFSVETVGLEPTTSCMPCKRSSQLSYAPEEGANIQGIGKSEKPQ